MRRVLGEALACKRRVDQVNRPQRILSHDQVTIHGLVKDPNEDFAHQPRMIMQVGGASARHLATQPHTSLDVVAARHLQVRTNIEAQAHERIGLGREALRQHRREFLGHLAHVREQEHFLVREVVVDRGATHAGTFGDLAHRDRLEGLLGHERPERLKQAGASQLAVRGE